MKITVYDPLKTFPAFIPHLQKSGHDVEYRTEPLDENGLRWRHISRDLVWYEFCTEEFARMVNAYPKECMVVCRLHSYELFTDTPGKVDWDKVDVLVGSSDYVTGLLEAKKDEFDLPPLATLSNGPDLGALSLMGYRKRNKSIALVARLNHKKNIPLAIYCMDELRDKDFELHVFGGSQDLRLDLYLPHLLRSLGLEDRVVFHGEVPHEEVVSALGSMDYILCTSPFESFGQGIMEGIARGCLPLIHDFPGARERFSGMEEAFFSSPREFASAVEAYESSDKDEIALRNRHLLERHSLDKHCIELDEIISYVAEELNESAA